MDCEAEVTPFAGVGEVRPVGLDLEYNDVSIHTLQSLFQLNFPLFVPAGQFRILRFKMVPRHWPIENPFRRRFPGQFLPRQLECL